MQYAVSSNQLSAHWPIRVSLAIGGTFVEKPLNLLLGQSDATVHCIGGACISKTGRGEHGATNHLGEVFKGNDAEIHEGLIVCDGALIPGALAVNPLATITALAERCVERFAIRNELEIDYKTRNGLLDLWGEPEHPIKEEDDDLKAAKEIIREAALINAGGFRFSEVMKGNVFIEGSMEPSNAQLFLTVIIPDTNKLINHCKNSAVITGSFICSGFQSPLIIRCGKFDLFSPNPDRPDSKMLEYHCKMIAKDGEELELHGYKFIHSSCTFSIPAIWKAMTTAHITIYRKNRSVVGRGILEIQSQGFLNQLKTMEATGNNCLTRAISYTKFMLHFSQNLAPPFFGPFSSLQWPVSDYHGFINITLPTKIYRITAIDGVQTTLHMWEPFFNSSSSAASKGPTLDILCISGASLDHQVFALPTIETNAVNYFREAGYRVYCLTHRVGRTMTARKGYTTFDARFDVHAALKRIRKLQLQPKDDGLLDSKNNRKIYIIGYCAGSIATASGLLDGTIPSHWLAGLTASNVFMHPQYALINTLKTKSPVPLTTLHNTIISSWFPCSIQPAESKGLQYLLTQILRFYPVASKSDICNSVTCHRSSFAFGGVFSHKNINAATHRQFHRFIGGVSMSTLSHLVEMGKRGFVTGNAPEYENLVTEHNIRRLKGLPILLFSGMENAIFEPGNTRRSYEVLREVLGEKADLEWVGFEGMGHLDCWVGREAWRVVYPRVRGHVDRVMGML